ncbi:MAG: alginate export family protein [Verrucomicrobiota bacterium]|nr:alginate export family protein [Verrucomicrobiota bacterium]
MKKLKTLMVFATVGLLAYQDSRAADAYDQLKQPIIESSMPAPNAPSWKPGDPISFFDGKLVFDVQNRLRFEYRENNFDFNSAVDSPTDDAWLLQRFRIGMRVKPNDWINAYVQGQDSREIDSNRPDDPGFQGSEGDYSMGLKQAHVTVANYKVSPFGATIGRQELNYGDERLVGAFDWNNIGRVFDGVKLRFQQPNWNIEAFGVMPVNMRSHHFDDTDYQDRFAGVYYTMNYIPKQTTDFYVFYRDKDNTDSGFPTGGTTFETSSLPNTVAGTQEGEYVTIGTRVKSVPGQLGPWDYGFEVAGQIGEIESNSVNTSIKNATYNKKDLLAMAGFVQGGYTFAGKARPRIGVGYDYASGDQDPNDGESTSFQNLFPTNHKFYGFMDLFGWRNLHNPRVNFSVVPVEKLALTLDYHAFFLDDPSDAWFRANSTTPVRATANRDRADRFAGQEIDLTATYPVCKWMRLHAGYSHFFAGPYLSNTGAARDADFVYVQTLFQF